MEYSCKFEAEAVKLLAERNIALDACEKLGNERQQLLLQLSEMRGVLQDVRNAVNNGELDAEVRQKDYWLRLLDNALAIKRVDPQQKCQGSAYPCPHCQKIHD